MADKLKILIIEDNKSISRLYDRALDSDTFEKVFVDDGAKALEVFDAENPDVVVLDIKLPGMSGYTLLKQMRVDRANQDTTIIMATSLGSEEDVMDCAKYGVQGYLVKPFNLKELQQKILECHATGGFCEGPL